MFKTLLSAVATVEEDDEAAATGTELMDEAEVEEASPQDVFVAESTEVAILAVPPVLDGAPAFAAPPVLGAPVAPGATDVTADDAGC